MRAVVALAALAVGTLAMPHNHKRDVAVVVETVTDYVYVYDVVTVTDNDGAVTSSTILSTTTTTALVTSTSAMLANRPYDVPTLSVIPATSSSDPVFSILPFPVTSSAPAPTVVMSATSTSIAVVSSAPFVFPPPVIPTSSAAAPTPSVGFTDPQNLAVTGYVDQVVAHHNVHRRNHSAPDVVWDNNLAIAAYRVASSCVYAHNTNQDRDSIGGYGQNIAAGVEAGNITAIITELFYNGEEEWYANLFGQAQPDMTNFEHWGHFSQIVWADTTKVGCYTWHCTNGLANVGSNVPPYFTVCNYQSPGNVAGQYNKVGTPLGYPTVHWDY